LIRLIIKEIRVINKMSCPEMNIVLKTIAKLKLPNTDEWIDKIKKMGKLTDKNDEYSTENIAVPFYLPYLNRFIIENKRFPNQKEDQDLWMQT